MKLNFRGCSLATYSRQLHMKTWKAVHQQSNAINQYYNAKIYEIHKINTLALTIISSRVAAAAVITSAPTRN